MKERLILLYELHRIDRELQELNSLKGDLPGLVADLRTTKEELEQKIGELTKELSELEEEEKDMSSENDKLLEKIEKDDSILRSGGVSSNKEYNALAKEIELGSQKIKENEAQTEAEILPMKGKLNEKISGLQNELAELTEKLKEHEEELEIVDKENEDEEKDLLNRRQNLLKKITADDLEFYERINSMRPGETMAIVRKGSCLGCFSSIPPQKSIEIRMAQKYFQCEACGRILIAEELINV